MNVPVILVSRHNKYYNFIKMPLILQPIHLGYQWQSHIKL